MLTLLLLLGAARAESPDPVLDAVAAEVERAMAELAKQPDPPYYLAVEVTDLQSVGVTGEDGALHAPSQSRWRRVDVDVRFGSPELDSSHPLRRDDELRGQSGALPITDDPAVLRRHLWAEIDERVRSARERWAKVTSDDATLVRERRGLDLAPAEPVVAMAPLVSLDVGIDDWSPVVRDASAVLAQDDVVRDGAVRFAAVAENHWFVSSEGTRIRHGRVDYMVSADVDTVTDDGAVLRLHELWSGPVPDALPDQAELIEGVGRLHAQLAALRVAPEQEPYTGPIVLSGKAAGVFFHEIFGHRIEGHRLKRADNAQTFLDRVGQPILPTFLSVVDDPTQPKLGEHWLRGHYAFDNEGVAAQPAEVVRDGILQGFLQSRSTVEPAQASNGHGRRSTGNGAVTRQGSLLVSASRSVSDEELREALIADAKAQGLPYALWVDDIQGGFTFTERNLPNAFKVDVLLARRVYVDGRPDELVRGVDLIGTPLVAFSRITLAGSSVDVFNGNCGAESGWVPVSAAAPPLLVSQLETQRKQKDQRTPPLLPAPKDSVEAGTASAEVGR